MTDWIWYSIWVISVSQISQIVSLGISVLNGWLYATVSFIMVHTGSRLDPFIVVSDIMWIQTNSDMPPKIIWLGGCFIVATTYFSSKCLSNGRTMCMWQGRNCCMVHSSENNTLFHSVRVQWQWRLENSSFVHFITGVAFVQPAVVFQSKFFAETSWNCTGTDCCAF